MKKSWFSFRLYQEGLRQLRLIGIMGMVILGLEAILIPVGRIVSIRQMERYAEGSRIAKELLNFTDMHPLLVLCFCVLAPLMVLYLFHFLNKRNASDFYHAIPETRLCLFISFFAAVVTWILAIIVVTSFISVAIFLCFPVYFSVNLTSVLVMCLNVFAGSLLVAASVAIAMCVTGTVFTNVIVALMIIFIPRLLILMLVNSVTANLPLVSSTDFIPLLDIQYNVPVGTVLFMMGGSGALTQWQSGVYTLVLALVYSVCAALLFRVRRSEAAGQSAPNRVLQAVYRLVLSMVVCSIACYSIFEDSISRSQNAGYHRSFYEYLVLYVIALVVFFLYELITTRKWSNLARSLPSLLVLVLLNVALIGGMTGLYRSALSFSPEANDISAIRILSSGRNGSYFAARTEHIDITDENARTVIARQLKTAVKICGRSRSDYYQYVDQNTVMRVAIRSRGVTHVRNIPMRDEDMETLAKPLADIEEYRRIYQQLPRLGQNSTTVSIGRTTLSDSSLRELYNTLCDEVASMPFEKWYPLISALNDEYYYYGKYPVDVLEKNGMQSLDVLQISTALGTDRYSFSIPLYTTLEKSCNTYLKLYKQNSPNSQDQKVILQMLAEGSWRDGDSLTVTGYNIQSNGTQWRNTTLYTDILKSNSENAAAFADDLLTHLEEEPDVTKPLYYIVLQKQDSSDRYGSSYTQYSAFFQSDTAELPALLKAGESFDAVYTYPTKVYNGAQVSSIVQPAE